ncbi:MAG: SNF2-related protein [Thermoplasmata archaeon]
MSRIIDNENEKMFSVLLRELSKSDEVAIASAYFNIGGFGLISGAIRNKPLKFLVGRPQDESISFEEQIVRELEENEDNPEYYNLMLDAVDFFTDDHRQVRKKTGAFFHGKAYIGATPSLEKPDYGVGIVGSSNFTSAGLSTNNELNVVNTDREVLRELCDWFSRKWESSEDYKDQFLNFLRNYTVTHTPYEVVAKALYEAYKDTMLESEKIKMMNLKRFQIVSVLEARKIISAYNGVVIADSTGLGKTRTMLALAHEARKEGKKVLLIAPKSVLRTTWEKEMEELDTHIENINSEAVSADPYGFVEKYSKKKCNFIIVDEAHYFKSSSSNRYKALRDLILRNGAQVVLATATPVNNTLMDLYNLIALFASEEAVQDIAGLTLRGYFTSNQKMLLEGRSLDMSSVLERFVVRHSRKFAKTLQPDVSFPERIIDTDPLNRYRSGIDYELLKKELEDLVFAQYDLSIEKLTDLRLPTGQPISQLVASRKKKDLKDLVKTIVILNLFKRIESSIEAFKETMLSIHDYMGKVIHIAEKTGYFLPRSAADDSLFDFDEEIPPDIFDNAKYGPLKERCRLTDTEKDWLIDSCKKDRDKINEILGHIPVSDDKLNRFKERLNKLVLSIKPPNGVVVFSQYTATARAVYNAVKDQNTKYYLTTGSECRDHEGRNSDTTKIVGLFQEYGGVLVSTDVLSEGQNLQNGQYVVNYDFPWNPVVLIQRAGRVDRMGSKHRKIYLINMMQENSDPSDPQSLEHFIGLMKKLYTKISGIKDTIGIDSPVLGEDADPKDFGETQKWIYEGKNEVLEAIAKELEQITNDPKDKLMEIIDQMGEEWIKAIPRGIGAYKKYGRDGLFSLFTDGSRLYWRLKFFDDDKVIADPGQIVSILVERQSEDEYGQKIEYKGLVEKLKALKDDTLEMIKADMRNSTSSSILPKMSKKAIAVYEKLASLDEELALRFRNVASRETLVNSLFESMNSADFLENATKVIEKIAIRGSAVKETQTTLKRVCWCLLSRAK